jgi:4-alpha-glucanotransferase
MLISNARTKKKGTTSAKKKIFAFQNVLIGGGCSIWLVMVMVLLVSLENSPYNPSRQYPKPPTFIDQDVPELQYEIDLRWIPTAQVPMIKRQFPIKERIWIKKKTTVYNKVS